MRQDMQQGHQRIAVRIGISGASGKLGRLAVDAALARVRPADLVVTTRTPAALADIERLGVDVRHADFDVPASLERAFAGVERLLLISASNDTGKRTDQHAAAIAAARRAGVRHLVFTSMPRADEPLHPVGLTAEEYRDAELLLAGSGVPYTILRNAPYAELHVIERLLPALQAGELRINAGTGTAAFISRPDIAEAAITVLLQDGHEGKTYDVTGNELLTYRQVVERAARVTGAALGYVDLDDSAFEHEATAAGLPPALVDTMTRIGKAIRDGYFAVRSDFFREVTGREPVSVRDVMQTHVEALRAAAGKRGDA
jgi:NAD(P)H dehydrogenase (quinone)